MLIFYTPKYNQQINTLLNFFNFLDVYIIQSVLKMAPNHLQCNNNNFNISSDDWDGCRDFTDEMECNKKYY